MRITFRTFIELLVTGICTIAFAATAAGIAGSLLANGAAGSRDFVEYWAAAHQLVHHADPYEATTLLPLERAAGYPSGIPVLIMANPPSALPLVLPLGFLSARHAVLLWLILLLASLVLSVRMIWTMHGRPINHIRWLGYSFAPALSCLLSGQLTIFLLLGLVLFLRFHRSRPFLSGLSLWFCLLKPHLFVVFGIVLAGWVIFTRGYRVLAGVLFALMMSTGIALVFDPRAWPHYLSMMRTSRVDRMNIPCLSIALRQMVWPHTLWLQCVPLGLGCLWAIWYFRKHREHWDWLEHGSLLVLISVLVAPYTWLMDQAVFLPALLHGAYLTKSRKLLGMLALGSAVVEIGILQGRPLLHSYFYLWTAPACVAWYFFATSPRISAPGKHSQSLADGEVTGAVNV